MQLFMNISWYYKVMQPMQISFRGPTSFSMVSVVTDLAPDSPNKPIYASHAEINVLAHSKFKLCNLYIVNWLFRNSYTWDAWCLLHECNATRVEEIHGDCIAYSCQLAQISILDVMCGLFCYSNTINFGLSSLKVCKRAHSVGDFELTRGESINL